MDWIHLAQDSDQWRVLVNTVLKMRWPFILSVRYVPQYLHYFERDRLAVGLKLQTNCLACLEGLAVP